MIEKERVEGEPEFRAEVYDHSGPKTLAGPLVSSLFLFAGGQLAKGQFLRALTLWAVLGGIIGLMILLSSITEPQSLARVLGAYGGAGAIGLLWLYQLWDAAWRPAKPTDDR
jgi:hypothetical protein